MTLSPLDLVMLWLQDLLNPFLQHLNMLIPTSSLSCLLSHVSCQRGQPELCWTLCWTCSSTSQQQSQPQSMLCQSCRSQSPHSRNFSCPGAARRCVMRPTLPRTSSCIFSSSSPEDLTSAGSWRTISNTSSPPLLFTPPVLIVHHWRLLIELWISSQSKICFFICIFTKHHDLGH